MNFCSDCLKILLLLNQAMLNLLKLFILGSHASASIFHPNTNLGIVSLKLNHTNFHLLHALFQGRISRGSGTVELFLERSLDLRGQGIISLRWLSCRLWGFELGPGILLWMKPRVPSWIYGYEDVPVPVEVQ